MDLIDLSTRWMPFAAVMTAAFSFCGLLFLAGAIRKLDEILDEIKKINEMRN